MTARRLQDVARFVRSKNAGPTLLTIDILLPDAAAYARALTAPALAAGALAELYGVAPARLRVIPYPPAFAIKIVIDRPIVAGGPGDRDVYGAQQHAPLLDLPL